MGEAVLSEIGEETSNISESAVEELGFERGIPPPNLNEGSCDSGLGFWGAEFMLKPLALDKDGLRGLDLLLSCGRCRCISLAGAGLDDLGVRQSENRVSVGVGSGVGDCNSIVKELRAGL